MYESGALEGRWQAKSSNYREADNLVRKIKTLVTKDTIRNHEVFLFTDNMVFKSTFYKSHSSSERLFAIIF